MTLDARGDGSTCSLGVIAWRVYGVAVEITVFEKVEVAGALLLASENSDAAETEMPESTLEEFEYRGARIKSPTL